jgi:hypothetical protein
MSCRTGSPALRASPRRRAGSGDVASRMPSAWHIDRARRVDVTPRLAPPGACSKTRCAHGSTRGRPSGWQHARGVTRMPSTHHGGRVRRGRIDPNLRVPPPARFGRPLVEPGCAARLCGQAPGGGPATATWRHACRRRGISIALGVSMSRRGWHRQGLARRLAAPTAQRGDALRAGNMPVASRGCHRRITAVVFGVVGSIPICAYRRQPASGVPWLSRGAQPGFAGRPTAEPIRAWSERRP